MEEVGAEPINADALDGASVEGAVTRVRPHAVINELTSLPKHYTPAEMKAAAERDRPQDSHRGQPKTCWPLFVGPGCAAICCSHQDSGTRRAAGLADKSAPFALDALPGVAASARTTGSSSAARRGHRRRRTSLRVLLRAGHLVHQRKRPRRAVKSAPAARHWQRVGVG